VKEIDQITIASQNLRRESERKRDLFHRASLETKAKKKKIKKREDYFLEKVALSARAYYFSRALLKQNINSVKRQLHG